MKKNLLTLVLVAKRDLAIGVRLTKDDVEWKAWPADAVACAHFRCRLRPWHGLPHEAQWLQSGLATRVTGPVAAAAAGRRP